MSLVLAIEPDQAQAEALTELQGRFGAELVVVSSKYEALRAIDREVPELVLVSALLSPRDEDDLMAHLRSIQDASHLQLLTIPRLGRAAEPAPRKASRFGFGKKRQTAAPEACDPAAFAEQVSSYLARARDVRSRPRPAIEVHEPAPAHARQIPGADPVTAPTPAPVPPWTDGSQDAVRRDNDIDLFAPAADRIPQPDDAVAHEVDELIARLGFGPKSLDEVRTEDPPAAILDAAVSTDADPLIDREMLIELDSLAIHESTTEREPRIESEAAIAAEPLIDPELLVEPPVLALDTRNPEPGASPPGLVSPPPVVQPPPTIVVAPPILEPAAAVDLARIHADAEAKLAAELERVQAEAAERREAELAQWRAEAEALRESTVGRARAEAEAEAREALAAELSRVRAEAEQLRNNEIARLQAEADERLEQLAREARQAAESEAARALGEQLARVRSETESVASKAFEQEVAHVRAAADVRLQEELARVRSQTESVASRAFEEEVARVRAAADARLQEELARVRREAEQARVAHEKQAQAEAEKIREAAAREARTVAEAAASRALEAEIQRVRAETEARLAQQNQKHVEAEKIREAAAHEARRTAEAAAARTLQAEIARVRAEAEARLASEMSQLRADAERVRATELEEIRRQVEQMRDAAAQQARAAASEAVAAEVARVAAQRGASPPISIIRTIPAAKVQADAPAPQQGEAAVAPAPAPAAASAVPGPAEPSGSYSYYDLWRSEGSPAVAPEKAVPRRAMVSAPSRFRRKRWMLPAAAAVLLVVTGSVRVDTTAWRESAKKALASAMPAGSEDEAAATAVAAAAPSGDLLVETTPKGAKVLVDGTPRGQTPLTVKGLKPGKHSLVLESSDGLVVRREVSIRANERSVASELMVSGWLTVFSRIPLDIQIGGRRVGRSGEGQLMLPPGRHKMTFVNERFKFRQTKTIEVQAGTIASHTVSLPSGTIHLEAPAGAEVFVDGERAGVAPLRPIKATIGTRDVYVRHPSIGEHREAIEVRYGVPAFVTVGLPSTDPRSFDGLKVLSESKANPGVRRPVTPRPPQ